MYIFIFINVSLVNPEADENNTKIIIRNSACKQKRREREFSLVNTNVNENV